MSEEYGANFISLTDDDGNEFELEHLDTIEYNGQVYMAFFPVEEADDEDGEVDEADYGLIILKVVHENGEDILVTVDDEEELNQVYDEFMETLLDDEE
jgi:uncharacterized protein YrzB (UPF0473 family)